LAAKVTLPAPGVGVPAKGPEAITTLFSGPKGSIPASSSVNKILEVKPRPPINSLTNSTGKGVLVISLVLKFILKILPPNPFINLLLKIAGSLDD
jgi:hypothetical protein